MKKSVISIGFVVMMVLSLLTGCSNTTNSSSGGSYAKDDYPVTINDVKFDTSPEKVVALSPSLADVVLALGYEIKLVGRTEACTQEDLSVLSVVNGPEQLNIEQIKALSADLVLTEQALTEDQEKGLTDAGIRVLTLTPEDTQEGIQQLYQNLGSVLGGAKTGYEKGDRTQKSFFMALDEVQRLAERQRGDIVVTACYLYDIQGKAVTGDQFASKLIEYSGAVNAMGDSTNGQIDVENLKLGNPNYIFCAPGVKEQLEKDEELSTLSAVQEGKVYEMEPTLLEWKGNALLDAVDFMAGTMYPALKGDSTDSSSSAETSSAASGNPFPAGTELKPGDSGEDVTKLQERLIELRFYYGVDESGVPSGVYDDATERGVQDFQYRMKMNANGIADDETLDAIYAPDAMVRTD